MCDESMADGRSSPEVLSDVPRGLRLTAVRVLTFDAGGGSASVVQNGIELTLGTTRHVFYRGSDRGSLIADQTTLEEEVDDVIDTLQDMYSICDVSEQEPWRSALGRTLDSIRHTSSGTNTGDVILIFGADRIVIGIREPAQFVYSVEVIDPAFDTVKTYPGTPL